MESIGFALSMHSTELTLIKLGLVFQSMGPVKPSISMCILCYNGWETEGAVVRRGASTLFHISCNSVCNFTASVSVAVISKMYGRKLQA